MSPAPSPAATTTAGQARTRLDRAAVVEAALGLADAEGLEGLTIRGLAKELGVTPTALYWHFADKQALLDALVDRLWSEAEELVPGLDPVVRPGVAPAPDPGSELRRIFGALVEVFRRHPALAPLAPTRVIDCPSGLALTERCLDLLGRAGYDDARGADAARFLLCTAMMLVTSQPGSWMADEAERELAMRQKRAALLTLPPGRFPHVEAAATHLVDCDERADSYFELGVELILGGLRAAAPGPGPAGL